jgi:hypothetical protein
MPDASHNKLYVDPWLSGWPPDLTIQDIRIGRHKLTLRFWLKAGETHFEVINGDPSIVERPGLILAASHELPLLVILVSLMTLIASGKNLKRSIQNTPLANISPGNLSRRKRTSCRIAEGLAKAG